MSERCQSCCRDCAELRAVKDELSGARRIVSNLANHNHSFAALKKQAGDFLARYPENP